MAVKWARRAAHRLPTQDGSARLPSDRLPRSFGLTGSVLTALGRLLETARDCVYYESGWRTLIRNGRWRIEIKRRNQLRYPTRLSDRGTPDHAGVSVSKTTLAFGSS